MRAENRKVHGVQNRGSYETKDKRFTGRHWWGQMSNDILEPIEDEKSKIIANEIGLPKRKLDNSSDMGTTLMIVDPDLGRTIT